MRTLPLLLVVMIAASAGSAASWRLAVADESTATPAMYYSGTLHQANVPVDGRRAIELALWADAVSSREADRLCHVSGEQTQVIQGHFRIALGADCIAALEAHTETWIELTVDGVALGRIRLGTVPYAQEAARAHGAAGTLAQQLVPAGMIAAFASACPSGWMEYEPLRGRFPRGEPGGNSGSLDIGGTDNAVVVAHGHSVSGVADGGDHAHGSGSLTTSSAGDHSHAQVVTANPGACPGSGIIRTDYTGDTNGNACAYAQGWGTAGAGAHAHSVLGNTASAAHSHAVRGTTSTDGTSGAGMNVPAFKEVLYCVKR